MLAGLNDIGPQMLGARAANEVLRPVGEGTRNATLFRSCMKHTPCDTFDQLLDVAQARNDEFHRPVPDEEVARVARSAWGYTERGENRFGRPGAFLTTDEANHLIKTDQDLMVLLMFLKANNRPGSTFIIAKGSWDGRVSALQPQEST